MIETGTRDLVANRWQAFKHTIALEGFDLTGGTFLVHLRLYRDAPGDPLIALSNATSPAEGISVSVETVEGLPTSTIEMRINETTIEGLLPFLVTDGQPNRKAGTDPVLVWDIHITATGLPKTRLLEGTFTIRGGSTQ